jgi:uncharacterized protein (TIGR03437 family)
VGNYNVTVTNGIVSAPVATQVVANKIGLFTQDSSGAGLASVQNYISASVVDLNRLTSGSLGGVSISPAKPGQPVIAYGTGLGAYAAGDDAASPIFDFRSSLDIKAVVGGVSIPVDFAGRAGYAGEDQINFTLPANVATGCAVSLQISVGGKLSAPTSIAIAPSPSADACVIPGFTTQQLQNFDKGGTYNIGAFYLSQFTETVPPLGTIQIGALGGAFYQFSGFQIGGASTTLAQVTPTEGCQVSHTTYTTNQTTPTPPAPTPTPTPQITITALDAGTITLTGPSGSSITNLPLKEDPTTSVYSASIGSGLPGQTGSTGTIIPGTYTLNGAGGKGVGPFTASVALGVTLNGGLPTNVVRSSGLTLNWTGGNATDLVEIIGGASTTSGTAPNLTIDTASFVCITTAGKGSFTVPASVLTQLPAVPPTPSGTIPTSYGSLSMYSTGNPTSGNGLFTAPLTAGGKIDYGYFLGFFGSTGSVTYQ